MNETALLHVTFALLVGLGFVVPNGLLTLALFALGIVCFLAGVVLARRGDDQQPPSGEQTRD